MTTIKGYLVECQGRELFLRENVEWALEDSHYTVTPLVAQETVLEGEIPDQTEPKFDDYVALSGQLYDLQQEHIAHLQSRLEEFVEVIEAIVEIAIPTDNIIENKAIILLVNEQCKKLLAEKDE